MHEIDLRLRVDLTKKGDFNRIHPLPPTGHDVPDDPEARLVVIGVDHPYSKEPGNAAETFAKAILEMRGNAPRLYRNALVFFAADKTRLQDLDAEIYESGIREGVKEKRSMNSMETTPAG